MFAWERIQQPNHPIALDGQFTPQERMPLVTLRARANKLRAVEESELNPYRLAFACWLVEHGYLREDM